MESSRYKNDAALLFVLTMAVLARNVFYLTEVHSYYDTIWCAHFCNFLRVLGNKKAYHERSVLRNLVFDCVRGLIRPIIYPLMFQGEINYPFLIEMTISTVVMSVLCTLFVPRSVFNKHCVVWAYLNTEFLLMFTDSFIYVMNQVETQYQGKIVYFMIVFYFECHFGLQGWLLEDLIFRDMNCLGGILHNWDFYVYYIVIIPVMYGLQYFHLGEQMFRLEAIGSISELSSEQKSPLKWRTVERHDQELRLFYVVGMTIFVFIGFFQFLGWFKQIDHDRLKRAKAAQNKKEVQQQPAAVKTTGKGGAKQTTSAPHMIRLYYNDPQDEQEILEIEESLLYSQQDATPLMETDYLHSMLDSLAINEHIVNSADQTHRGEQIEEDWEMEEDEWEGQKEQKSVTGYTQSNKATHEEDKPRNYRSNFNKNQQTYEKHDYRQIMMSIKQRLREGKPEFKQINKDLAILLEIKEIRVKKDDNKVFWDALELAFISHYESRQDSFEPLYTMDLTEIILYLTLQSQLNTQGACQFGSLNKFTMCNVLRKQISQLPIEKLSISQQALMKTLCKLLTQSAFMRTQYSQYNQFTGHLLLYYAQNLSKMDGEQACYLARVFTFFETNNAKVLQLLGKSLEQYFVSNKLSLNQEQKIELFVLSMKQCKKASIEMTEDIISILDTIEIPKEMGMKVRLFNFALQLRKLPQTKELPQTNSLIDGIIKEFSRESHLLSPEKINFIMRSIIFSVEKHEGVKEFFIQQINQNYKILDETVIEMIPQLTMELGLDSNVLMSSLKIASNEEKENLKRIEIFTRGLVSIEGQHLTDASKESLLGYSSSLEKISIMAEILLDSKIDSMLFPEFWKKFSDMLTLKKDIISQQQMSRLLIIQSLSQHMEKNQDEQLISLLVNKPTLFSLQDLIDVRNNFLQRSMQLETLEEQTRNSALIHYLEQRSYTMLFYFGQINHRYQIPLISQPKTSTLRKSTKLMRNFSRL